MGLKSAFLVTSKLKTGSSEAIRKWGGTEIFNLKIFSTELCCHCSMKVRMGTCSFLFRVEKKWLHTCPLCPPSSEAPRSYVFKLAVVNIVAWKAPRKVDLTIVKEL